MLSSLLDQLNAAGCVMLEASAALRKECSLQRLGERVPVKRHENGEDSGFNAVTVGRRSG